MAWYTTKVKSICETYSGLPEGSNYKDTIPLAIPKIFDFEFPIFDESYKTVLCTKFLKRYYMKEIGQETVGLWKLQLDTSLNEIMPYYNQLYKSTLIEFNPLYDVDLTRISNKKGNTNKTSLTHTNGTVTDDGGIKTTFNTDQNSTNNNTNGVVSSDNLDSTRNITNNSEIDANNSIKANKKDRMNETSQGGITGLENGDYMTKAQIVDDVTENTGKTLTKNTDKETLLDKRTGKIDGTNKDVFTGNTTGTNNQTKNNINTSESSSNSSDGITSLDDYLEKVSGKQGTESYSSLLLKFRETFINIDKMILDDLASLFMGIWNFEGGQING